ncbi:hypothetical protein OH492_27425 [Vibrio chagasii]|nr:hypothetical protein [Vibrio chagasii]
MAGLFGQLRLSTEVFAALPSHFGRLYWRASFTGESLTLKKMMAIALGYSALSAHCSNRPK